MKIVGACLSTVFMALAPVTAVAADCDQREWTVSELQRANFSDFHEPILARGVLKAGEHGLYLLDEHCSAMCEQVVKIDTSNFDKGAARSAGLDAQISGRQLHNFRRRYIATMQVEVDHITPPVPPGQLEIKPRLSALQLVKLCSIRP